MLYILNNSFFSLLNFLFSSIIEIYLTNKKCMYLRSKKWWFDIYIYCEMITAIMLVNTSITSQSHYFLCGDNTWDPSQQILSTQYSVTNYGHHANILNPQNFLILHNWTLVPFDQHPSPAPTPGPGRHYFTLCFYELDSPPKIPHIDKIMEVFIFLYLAYFT